MTLAIDKTADMEDRILAMSRLCRPAPTGSHPVHSMSLVNRQLDDLGATCVCEALRRNQHIDYINLYENKLTDVGVLELIKIFRELPAFRKFYLGNNLLIGSDMRQHLCDEEYPGTCLMRANWDYVAEEFGLPIPMRPAKKRSLVKTLLKGKKKPPPPPTQAELDAIERQWAAAGYQYSRPPELEELGPESSFADILLRRQREREAHSGSVGPPQSATPSSSQGAVEVAMTSATPPAGFPSHLSHSELAALLYCCVD